MKEKTFNSLFLEEEKEFVVVMISGVSGGKAQGDNYWQMTADFLAYECEGQIFEDRGFLCWLSSEEERENESYKFKSNTIYRIKARELKEKQSSRYRNRLLVTQILDSDVSSSVLEELLTKYREPITINDDVLGLLTLDKQYFELEGDIQFGKNEDVHISMDVDEDEEDKSSWKEPINVARKLVFDAEKLDIDMRKFAAEHLTDNANDWQDNLEQELPEITPEQFAARLTMEELHVYEDGGYTVYYDDDDMFFGHVVVVDANVNTGFERADIEG